MTYEQKQSTRKCYNFHKEQINKNILTVIAVKKKNTAKCLKKAIFR